MIASQTAWPFRWLEMAQQPRPCFSSVSRFACTYPSSSAALATSKWSPEQAISSPSYPHSPASRHISSNGRSAHCPVNKVTGRVCSGWAFPFASLIATPLFAGSEPVIAPRSELVEDHRCTRSGHAVPKLRNSPQQAQDSLRQAQTLCRPSSGHVRHGNPGALVCRVEHCVANGGGPSTVGEGRQAVRRRLARRMRPDGGVAVGNESLEALRVALSVTRGQRGQPALLRRAAGGVPVQHGHGLLGPDQKVLGVLLVEGDTVPGAVHLQPESVLPAGGELRNHGRSGHVVGGSEQDQRAVLGFHVRQRGIGGGGAEGLGGCRRSLRNADRRRRNQ